MTPFRPALVVCVLLALPSRAAERRLVDEVVAVVEAQSITLSEVEAETRIRLAEERGPAVAMVNLDRPLLAASLRRLVEERVVLAEIERLRLFDLEPGEREVLLRRLRAKFGSVAAWEEFLRKVEMTEDEVGGVLARGLRVARYLDNRLKLAAQLRDSELADGLKSLSGAESKAGLSRDLLRLQLSREKYEKLLVELLAELRKRANVRVLDPLDGTAGPAGAGRP